MISELSVRARVTAHVALHAEGPATALERAYVWSLACMAVQVDLQATRTGETLPAVAALILC